MTPTRVSTSRSGRGSAKGWEPDYTDYVIPPQKPSVTPATGKKTDCDASLKCLTDIQNEHKRRLALDRRKQNRQKP